MTGSRVSSPLRQIPAAMSIVEGSEFRNTRAISLKDALQSVPGVFVQSRGGGQDVRVTIRGYGARGSGERSNAGNMRGIRIMTDGVPVTEPDGRTSLDLADLGIIDRVEISRSNVSALYGNASGGVVNLLTDLSFDSPYLEFRERGGSFGFHREQGRGGFALGNTRGVVTLSNSTYKGWRVHSMSTIAQARARIVSTLDERSKLGINLDALTSLNRFAGALTQAQFDADPRQANPRFVSRDERRDNEIYRASTTFNRTVGTGSEFSMMLFAEPKVLHRSERNRFRDFNRYHVGGNALWSWKHALSEGSDNQLTAGIDEAWQDGAILFYNLAPGGQRSNVVFANKREGANSGGVFVQDALNFGDWTITGAARYDAVVYVSEDFITPKLGARKTFEHVTPKGSISYARGDHTVFVALGGGVESPAFNEIDPPPPFDTVTTLNPFLDAMVSTTVEAGARGLIAGSGSAGSLRYDLAVYQINVKDDIVPYDGGAYFTTAGKSRRRGVEAGLEWSPLQALSLRGSATMSKNEYIIYANQLGDFAGKDIAGMPSFYGSLRGKYAFPGGLSVSATLDAVGKYFADDANTGNVPSFSILGATLEYARQLGGQQVEAFVSGNNLTDKTYVGSAYINGTGGEFFEAGLPRNWSAGLSIHW